MHNQERAQCAFGEEARVHARVLGCQRGRKMKSTHHKNAFLCAQPDVSLSPSGVIIIHEATLSFADRLPFFYSQAPMVRRASRGSEMGRDGLAK
jgi:hypothetical protein